MNTLAPPLLTSAISLCSRVAENTVLMTGSRLVDAFSNEHLVIYCW